jgi:tetratricopeptide (TPR) repeat protein
MGPDDDLEALILSHDHVNVMRYLRIHQLRQPELAYHHGMSYLFGSKEKVGKLVTNDVGMVCHVLEQTILASVDLMKLPVTEQLLSILSDKIETLTKKDGKKDGKTPTSVRFRLLVGRLLEAYGNVDEAASIYRNILSNENPCNILAHLRLYCIQKSKNDSSYAHIVTLNQYLQDVRRDDVSAWYEMYQQQKNAGQFLAAAYALEECIVQSPASATDGGTLHVELAECYLTAASTTQGTAGKQNQQLKRTKKLDLILMGRKHMAQALEISPNNRRALFGLVYAANAYLLAVEEEEDQQAEHESEVAQALVQYGADRLLESYQTSHMFPAVEKFLQQFTTP